MLLYLSTSDQIRLLASVVNVKDANALHFGRINFDPVYQELVDQILSGSAESCVQ